MKRRFTKKNVHDILGNWPQAVSADAGDLRILHDMANQGAQMWRESLFWPDYLWLGLENVSFDHADRANEKQFGVLIKDPTGFNHDADFGVVTHVPSAPLKTGTYALSNRIECLLEVKAITADPVTKIKNFIPEIPWSKFLMKKLDHAFLCHLRHANNQIRDCKRILGLQKQWE